MNYQDLLIKPIEKFNSLSKTAVYEYTGDEIGIALDKYVPLLKSLGIRHPNTNVRICFHNNNTEHMHKMLILERRGHGYHPHVHQFRDELHFVCDGVLGVARLDKFGKVINTFTNSCLDQTFTSIDSGIHHITLPLSSLVIYLEIKNGRHIPFNSECFEPSIKNQKFISLSEYNSYVYSCFPL